ncbi:MAG: hypothetical protein ACXAC8_17395 [Candidatus Hodarchaeales archaeon]
MSEIQKELEKAKTSESQGNFDKAAQSYFKIAQISTDNDQRIKLFNKAFFTSRKSGNTELMYQLGKTYYDALETDDEDEKIKELLPTFLEISGRIRSQLTDQSPEKLLEVLEWTTNLYSLAGNTDAAYDISQETGNTFFTYGQQLLSSSHLLGKEEKWQRGLNLFDSAITSYQQIRLDSQALEKILVVKLDRIDKLIEIGRHVEGIEDTANLMKYYSSHPKEIIPFSKKDLSFKIAELLAEKSLNSAQAKRFNISKALMKTALAGYKSAGKFTSITPFYWQLALIYDEHKQKEQFSNLVDTTFEMAQKYKDDNVQSTIFNYLNIKTKEICNNILNSRMLMVKKGPIEFQHNEGINYLLKALDLANRIGINDIQIELLDFLFHYAKGMYTKKLTKRSLPYFEFCTQTLWNLPVKEKSQILEILNFLEMKFNDLLTLGKFDDAGVHLGSIVSIKTFTGKAEEAGVSAFSFASVAGQQNKQEIEITFLGNAIDAFISINEKTRLQEMLDYIIQRSDPLFNLESKSQGPREKLVSLGKVVTGAISDETKGSFLQATTFKALNSGLTELGIESADEAFNVIKEYDQQTAADILFRVGSSLLDTDLDTALEFIAKSTRFAVKYEPLQDVVVRNLNYMQEKTLAGTDISIKLRFAKKFQILTEKIEKSDIYNEFLFIFIQNLAERTDNESYFTEMKTFLDKAFETFYSIDVNHPKIMEIISWLNTHILEDYSVHQTNQVYELALQDLSFHEKTHNSQGFIDLFWKVFDRFVSLDKFSLAIKLFKETDQYLSRIKETDSRQEVTEKVVVNLNRAIKPRIADEKYDDAWLIINGLYSILEKVGLLEQAIDLYEHNASLFAPHRLDLALTMWNQSIESAKTTKPDSLNTIATTIIDDIIPIYKEKGNSAAVNQLYLQAIDAYKHQKNTKILLDLILKVTQYYLSLSDFDNVKKFGQKGFSYTIENKSAETEKFLFEFSNMFFAVGSGMLETDPDLSVSLLEVATSSLKEYGKIGFDYYLTKMAEIYGELYNFPATKQIAQNERTQILAHFKDAGKQKEKANFLVTVTKLSFQAGNINEGLELITEASQIYRELDDSDGLGDVVSLCLKTASNFGIGTAEYEALSRIASDIQSSSDISEEKTQDAFGDIFDDMLDDMTSLLDPKQRKKRKK